MFSRRNVHASNDNSPGRRGGWNHWISRRNELRVSSSAAQRSVSSTTAAKNRLPSLPDVDSQSFVSPTRRDTVDMYGMLARGTSGESRLQEIAVFEIDNEGGESKYSTMTLRALYNYVVSTITDSCKQAKDERTLITARFSTDFRGVEDQGGRETTKVVSFSSPSSARQSLNNNVAGSSRDVGSSRERLGGYLHPRDMRRLVTPFSSSNEPQLMVRRHVILLNFDPLR